MASCFLKLPYSIITPRKSIAAAHCKSNHCTFIDAKKVALGTSLSLHRLWKSPKSRRYTNRNYVSFCAPTDTYSMTTKVNGEFKTIKDAIFQVSQTEAKTLIIDYCKIDQREPIQLRTEIYPISLGLEKVYINPLLNQDPLSDVLQESSAYLTLSGGTYWTIEDSNKSRDVATGRRYVTRDDLTQMLVVTMMVSVPLPNKPSFVDAYEAAVREETQVDSMTNQLLGFSGDSPSRRQRKTATGSLNLEEWISYRQGPLPGLAAHWGVANLQRQTKDGLAFVFRTPTAPFTSSSWVPGAANLLAPTRWISPPKGWRSRPDFSYHLGFNATQTPFDRPRFFQVDGVGNVVDGAGKGGERGDAQSRWFVMYPLLLQMRYEGAVKGADGGLAMVLRIPSLPSYRNGQSPGEIWVKGSLPPFRIPFSQNGSAPSGRPSTETKEGIEGPTSQWTFSLDEQSSLSDHLAPLLPHLLSPSASLATNPLTSSPIASHVANSGPTPSFPFADQAGFTQQHPSPYHGGYSGVVGEGIGRSLGVNLEGGGSQPNVNLYDLAATAAAKLDIVGVFRLKHPASYQQRGGERGGVESLQHANRQRHSGFRNSRGIGGDPTFRGGKKAMNESSGGDGGGGGGGRDNIMLNGLREKIADQEAFSVSRIGSFGNAVPPPLPDKSAREPFEGVDFVFPTSALPDLIGGGEAQGTNAKVPLAHGLPRFVCWTPPSTSDRDACPTQPKTITSLA